MSTPYVVLSTPCYGGVVFTSYMTSVFQTLMACLNEKITLRLNFLDKESLITRARNRLTADFLDIPEATHLLFIDADISFKPEQFLRLLRFDKDVVAASYPVKNIYWNKVANRVAEGEAMEQAGLLYTARTCTGADLRVEGDFATADYVATGFLLIKRAVIERMIAAYPETKFRYFDAPRADVPPRETLYALFDCEIDRGTEQYLSEDYTFCKRWRKIGGEIWLDMNSSLTHEGTYKYKGQSLQRYMKALDIGGPGAG